jgi:hypothetical protein
MADVDFVDSLYRNVLARDPDVDGLNAWVSAIGSGATYDQVRSAFINSAEAQSFVNPVIRLYEGLLGRAPDSAGLKAWTDVLRGGASLTDITDAFLNCDEAVANGFGGLDNQAFVNKLYLSMGRTQAQIDADVDGVGAWVNALNSMSRATVAQAFMECAESLQHSNHFVSGYLTLRAHGKLEPSAADINGFIADQDFVEGLYRNVLDREPDADGASAWVNYVTAGGTHEQVTAAFVNSAEAQTFVNPIVRLYEGLLNRAPDVEGLKAWTDVLRGGVSLTDITNAFLNCDEAVANGFAQDLTAAEFVTKLYAAMGRTPEQIAADPDGVASWVSALDTMSRAEVAQAFMECAENLQNSSGFVNGWGALRAAGNPGPSTAQLDNFSDTATVEQIIASAEAVGASTTVRPTGEGASPYDLSDTAANLAAADPRLLNGATNITVTDTATVAQAAIIEAAENSGVTTYSISDSAENLARAGEAVLNGATDIVATDPTTVAQATIIDAASNSGATTYNISDSAAHLETADPAVLGHATAIDAAGNADVTLTGDQVTDDIIAKFDGSDDLTLNATGAQLAALSPATLADADVVSINASNATLVELATIRGAANPAAAITYGLADTGAVLGKADIALLQGATGINAIDDVVTLSDYDDGRVTNETIGKFDASDRLTLEANHGTIFSALSAATLGDAKVYVLDAFDNAVTLTDDQVTDAIVGKFDPTDTLTLKASGETLSALSAETLRYGNPSLVLDATDNAITLTADQFLALDLRNHVIDSSDDITIDSGVHTNALDLNGVGGGKATVRFTALDQVPDDIHNFDVATDTLQFSKAAFAGLSETGAIATEQFLSSADVTGAGNEGTVDTRFLYDTDSGDLYFDADGSGAGDAVQIATLGNVPILTEADIVMIA